MRSVVTKDFNLLYKEGAKGIPLELRKAIWKDIERPVFRIVTGILCFDIIKAMEGKQ